MAMINQVQELEVDYGAERQAQMGGAYYAQKANYNQGGNESFSPNLNKPTNTSGATFLPLPNGSVFTGTRKDGKKYGYGV